MSALPKLVGERIKALRKTKGWTQEELAERADLHYSYIGGVERGERNISLETLDKISAALQVAPVEFFLFDTNVHEGHIDKKAALDIHLSLLMNRDVADIKMLHSISKEVLRSIDARD